MFVGLRGLAKADRKVGDRVGSNGASESLGEDSGELYTQVGEKRELSCVIKKVGTFVSTRGELGVGDCGLTGATSSCFSLLIGGGE
jgi:hypothetical protein